MPCTPVLCRIKNCPEHGWPRIRYHSLLSVSSSCAPHASTTVACRFAADWNLAALGPERRQMQISLCHAFHLCHLEKKQYLQCRPLHCRRVGSREGCPGRGNAAAPPGQIGPAQHYQCRSLVWDGLAARTVGSTRLDLQEGQAEDSMRIGGCSKAPRTGPLSELNRDNSCQVRGGQARLSSGGCPDSGTATDEMRRSHSIPDMRVHFWSIYASPGSLSCILPQHLIEERREKLAAQPNAPSLPDSSPQVLMQNFPCGM